ncbi:MAG TPA: hypothetical protein VN654_25690 [Vicinamibacterales bacterium]|nr:hypothetical protein [Vicinamibacterales bacterium]
MADELDDYLERARIEAPAAAAPDGFTDRVVRRVRRGQHAAPRFDMLATVVSSGSLVGSGALLWLSGESTAMAAGAILAAMGFLWLWLDDPFAQELNVSLYPW